MSLPTLKPNDGFALMSCVGKCLLSRDPSDTYDIIKRCDTNTGENAEIKCAWTYDNGRMLFVIDSTAIRLYDLSIPDVPIEWSITNTTLENVIVSEASRTFLITASKDVWLYDLDTFTLLQHWATNQSSSLRYKVSYMTPDGAFLVKPNDDDASQVDVVDLATFTILDTHQAHTSTSYGYILALSDDARYVCFSSANNKFKIYDRTNSVLVAEITTSTNYAPFVVLPTPNANEIRIKQKRSPSYPIKTIDLTTGTIIQDQVVSAKYMYHNGDTIVTGDNTHPPRILTVNSANNQLLDQGEAYDKNLNFYHKYDGIGSGTATYEVIDTITESLINDQFHIQAFSETGELVADMITTAGEYHLPVAIPDPLYVTITPYITKRKAKRDTLYAVNDTVFSDDPAIKWSYRCVIAGTTAVSPSPAWSTSAGTQFTDGSVTWEAVEPLCQPITKYPVFPTVIP